MAKVLMSKAFTTHCRFLMCFPHGYFLFFFASMLLLLWSLTYPRGYAKKEWVKKIRKTSPNKRFFITVFALFARLFFYRLYTKASRLSVISLSAVKRHNWRCKQYLEYFISWLFSQDEKWDDWKYINIYYIHAFINSYLLTLTPSSFGMYDIIKWCSSKFQGLCFILVTRVHG